jgi:hypothetical protein
MKRNLHAVVLLASWFVAACGGQAIDARAVGLYRLDQTSMRLGKADFGGQAGESGKNAPPQEASFSLGLDLDVTFDLRADGTAVMRAKATHNGQPVEESTTGAWRLAGGKLTIQTKDKAGKDETKTVDYVDGSFSVEEEKGGQKMKMTFRKK